MAIKDAFIAELKHESSMTKKILERVPLDKKDWKPHEKSMTVGRLATHIAQTPHWICDILEIDDFDFMVQRSKFPSNTAASSEELLQIFQENLDKALARLESAGDEEMIK